MENRDDEPIVNIQVYVYWYNRTDQYLYRANNSTETGMYESYRYVRWATEERVLSIVGHRTQPSKSVALARNKLRMLWD